MMTVGIKMNGVSSVNGDSKALFKQLSLVRNATLVLAKPLERELEENATLEAKAKDWKLENSAQVIFGQNDRRRQLREVYEGGLRQAANLVYAQEPNSSPLFWEMFNRNASLCGLVQSGDLVGALEFLRKSMGPGSASFLNTVKRLLSHENNGNGTNGKNNTNGAVHSRATVNQ